jgi:hypothetical protein
LEHKALDNAETVEDLSEFGGGAALVRSYIKLRYAGKWGEIRRIADLANPFGPRICSSFSNFPR